MTEQQIKDGFDQLQEALAPPLDSLERIDRRVRVRRRRRRAVVAGSTAAGVVAVGAWVAVGLGGPDGTDAPVAVDPPPGLVAERPDGSSVAFGDVRVSCDPPKFAGGDPLGTGPDRIWAWSPMRLSQSGEHEDDAVLAEPFFYAEGVVSKLQGDRALRLPIDGPGASDTYPLTLFVADTEGGTQNDPGNEVASSAGGSGTVRVLEASCDPVPVLRLEVDGILASEEGKQSLKLVGRLP